MKIYIVIAVVVLLGVLIFYLCKYHANLLFNLILRTVFGIASIYLINAISAEIGLISLVGINEVSIAICAAFGIPGLFLLYGGAIILKN